MYPEIRTSSFQLNQPAITATGDSASWVQDGVLGAVVVDVNVTAATGTTPSLTIQPQVSTDGGTTWFNAGAAGSALTAAGTQRFALSPVLEGLMRLAYTVSGTTPNFTATILVYQR